MIEATEIQAQSDLFDFLRIIQDEASGRMEPEETGSGSNFSVHSIHQFDSVFQSDAKIKEKA